MRVIGTAPQESSHLLDVVGTIDGEIEVPAGIGAALEMAFAEASIDAVSLWARVPHYVASMSYPLASAALVDSLAAVAGLSVSSKALRRSADDARERVNDLITNNPDHQTMVEDLERTVDETEGGSLGAEIPSGDELAEELERFLRGETD